MTSLSAAVVLALLAPSASGEAVALLPTEFDGELEQHWQEAIVGQIEDGFGRGDFRVVPSTRVLELLPSAATCRQPACRAKALDVAGADFIVRSVVTVADRDYTVQMDVADPAGNVVATSAEQCGLCGAEEVAELAGDLAGTMRTKIETLLRTPPVLTLISEPFGAKVTIDGRDVGITPLEQEVTPGPHKIEVSKEGFITQQRTVEGVAGVRDMVTFSMLRSAKDWKTPAWKAGWVTLGVGLAGVGAGATMLVLHERPYRANCEADTDGDCRNLYDTQTGGIIATATGGALLVTGIALVIVARDHKRHDISARLRPTANGIAVAF